MFNIVHYTFQNLPKEYDMFKEMQTNNDRLLTYKALQAKLLSKETILRLIAKDRGKVLKVEGHRSTFGDSRNCRLQVQQNPNVFFGVLNNYHCLMVQGRNSNNFQNTNPFSTTNQLGHNSTNNYQPCYRLRGTNQPRLVVYDCCRNGHLIVNAKFKQ
jgi:hypothetical protein